MQAGEIPANSTNLNMKTILLLLMTVLTAHALPFTPLVNSSSVSVSGSLTYQGTQTYADSRSASDTGPFNEVVSGMVVVAIPNQGPDPGVVSSVAWSESVFGPSGFEASGGASTSARGIGSPWTPAGAGASAASLFDLVFTLSEFAHYTLAGHLLASRLTLSILGGPSLIQAGNTDGDWSLTGVLPPGDYRMTALADAPLAVWNTIYATSGAGFEFSLDFTDGTSQRAAQVPEQLSTIWLALPLIGMAAWWWVMSGNNRTITVTTK